jgi:hypothetical protein
MSAPNPGLCTEATNPNYTIGTFRLRVREEGAVSDFDVGNITTGNFEYTPNVVEHRRGIDNSLDALFRIGTDYTINFTGDEVTAENLAMLLNETMVNVAGGCQIPLTGSRCVKEFGVELTHDFPCQERSLVVTFWRAAILAAFTLNFEAGGNAAFTGAIRALDCSSVHPGAPYGTLFDTRPCPAS